jgi:hypothetical protein
MTAALSWLYFSMLDGSAHSYCVIEEYCCKRNGESLHDPRLWAIDVLCIRITYGSN